MPALLLSGDEGRGVLDLLFFQWVTPLIKLGTSRPLVQNDCLQLDADVEPSTCGKALYMAESSLQARKRSTRANLFRCFWRLYWKQMVKTGALKLLNDVLIFVSPLLIKLLVDWLTLPLQPIHWPEQPTSPWWDAALQYVLWFTKMCHPGQPVFGLVVAAALGGCAVARGLLSGAYNWNISRLQAQIRSGMQIILYDKSLAIGSHLAAPIHNDNDDAMKHQTTPGHGEITPCGNKQQHITGTKDGADKQVHKKQKETASNADSHACNGKRRNGVGQNEEEHVDVIPDVSSLVGVDIGRLLNFPNSFHELWSLPVQLIAALLLLYCQVRYAFVAGLFITIMLIPINKVISQRILAATQAVMKAKDKRLSHLSDLLQGMRAIKCLAWEDVVLPKIYSARGEELSALATHKYLDAACVFLWATTSLLFTCLTFGVAAWLGVPLTPGAAATAFALFQILIFPLNAIPWVINGVLEAWVSMGRLQSYLDQPEHPRGRDRGRAGDTTLSSNCQLHPNADTDHAHALNTDIHTTDVSTNTTNSACVHQQSTVAIFSQASFTYAVCHVDSAVLHALGKDQVHASLESTSGKQDPDVVCAPGPGDVSAAAAAVTVTVGGVPCCLKNVDLVIPEGSFTVITGQVGSGKSSLLSALLGELQLVEGSCQVPGRLLDRVISYAPQSPWLLSGTIRDNILLGNTLDEARYQQVLYASALSPDLSHMPQGDGTWVTEGGASLSGGQRARVALARALYAPSSSVVLLDDVLAALDARSAKHVTAALLGPREATMKLPPPPPQRTTSEEVAGTGTKFDGGRRAVQERFMAGVCGQEVQQQQQELGDVATPAFDMFKDRTVLAISQSRRWMLAADQLIVLHQGRVQYSGPPRLWPGLTPSVNTGAITVPSLSDHNNNTLQNNNSESVVSIQRVMDQCVDVKEDSGNETMENDAADTAGGGRDDSDNQSSSNSVHDEEQQQQEVCSEEERAVGAVSGAVWWSYFSSAGVATCVIVAVSLIAMQVSKNGADVWVASWIAGGGGKAGNNSSSSSGSSCVDSQFTGSSCFDSVSARIFSLMPTPRTLNPVVSSTGISTSATWVQAFVSKSGLHEYVNYTALQDVPVIDTSTFLTGLIFIAGFNTVATLARALSFTYATLKAAKRNHVDMMAALMAAPLTYLEALPAGRLFNRFASDVSKVDDYLPFIFNIFLAQLVTLAGLLSVMLYVAPSLVLLLLPLFFIYRSLANRYRCSSREIRRLEAVALSPVMSGFSSSCGAAPSVRAFAVLPLFRKEHLQHVTQYQRAALTGNAASIWLSVRLQLLAASLLTALAVVTSIGHILEAQHTPAAAQPYNTHNIFNSVTVDSTTSGSHDLAASLLLSASSRISWFLRMLLGSTAVHSGSFTSSSNTNTMASIAGLCLAYALPVVQLLEGLVSTGSETETEMVAVERCKQLCDAPRQQDVMTSCGVAGSRQHHVQDDYDGHHAQYDQTRKKRAVASANTDLSETLLGPPVQEEDVEAVCAPASLRDSSSMPQHQHDGVVATSTSMCGTSPEQIQQGVIVFHNVVLRYPGRDVCALDGCSFSAAPEEWVGFVGATGAGKSSVLSAVLRLVEISSGAIFVHGRDIRSIPLRTLRRMFGVVPQSPFLTSGSIRDNLDPFHRCSDDQLIAALKCVQLLHVLEDAAKHSVAGRVMSEIEGACVKPRSQQHNSLGASLGSGCVGDQTQRGLQQAVLGLHIDGTGMTGAKKSRSKRVDAPLLPEAAVAHHHHHGNDHHATGCPTEANISLADEGLINGNAQHSITIAGHDDPGGDCHDSASGVHINVCDAPVNNTSIIINDTASSPGHVCCGSVGLSAGQQQLLCLARLLVSGKQLVLLDEVTACVDPATAQIIHQVLRQQLLRHPTGSVRATIEQGQRCPSMGPSAEVSQMCMSSGISHGVTVLHVAHQLDHVMDHSRVIVMDKGKVVQQGQPQVLLSQPDGHFARLVAAAQHHHNHQA